MSLSLYSVANRLAFLQKNERTACTHRKSAFFLLHFLSILLLPYSLAIFFKLHFAFHSPRNVLFLDTFSHVCEYVIEYIYMKEFCALYFGWFLCCVFSSNFTFFLLYTTRFVSRISYSSWFVVSLFVVLEILAFFLCSVALPWRNKKKTYISHSPTSSSCSSFSSISFIFRKLFFRFLFLSLTHSPLPTLLI